MMSLFCWLLGHRWTYAKGWQFQDRFQLGLPLVWCDRCDPAGKVHRVVERVERPNG